MGFSSRLKAHKKMLTLETLKFISEYLVDGSAKGAALRSGISETYAARQGAWLKKHPIVIKALENDLNEDDLKKIHKLIKEINSKMEACKEILGIDEI
jgi:phage terminase small subunit